VSERTVLAMDYSVLTVDLSCPSNSPSPIASQRARGKIW
jgi:hypothetical protein